MQLEEDNTNLDALYDDAEWVAKRLKGERRHERHLAMREMDYPGKKFFNKREMRQIKRFTQ